MLCPRAHPYEEADQQLNSSTAGIAYGLVGGAFVNPTVYGKPGLFSAKKSNAAAEKKAPSAMMQALMKVMAQKKATRKAEDPLFIAGMTEAGRGGVHRRNLEAVTAPGCLGWQGAEGNRVPASARTPRRESARPASRAGAASPTFAAPVTLPAARPQSSRAMPRTPGTRLPLPSEAAVLVAAVAAAFPLDPHGGSSPSKPKKDEARFPAGLQRSYRSEFSDFQGCAMLLAGQNGRRRAVQCGHGMNGCQDGGWVGAVAVADAQRDSLHRWRAQNDKNTSGEVAEMLGGAANRPPRPRSVPLGGPVDHDGRPVNLLDTAKSEEEQLLDLLTARPGSR